jgi:chromosome transmission fidelity protein 1
VVELTHANRSALVETLRCVGIAILNLAHAIPHGIIVAFPSYAMEEAFFSAVQATGDFDRINAVKRIFREQQGAKGDLDTLLTRYEQWILGSTPKRGALLSCVMGGKLSEGINFNDELGRGLIVVGVPYPNVLDLELRLLLHHSCAGGAARPPTVENLDSALRPEEAQLYHGLCMRTVNQTVGRCIRHVRDYAVVILLDSRYSKKRELHGNLPQWMQPSLRHTRDFGDCFRVVRSFFQEISQ